MSKLHWVCRAAALVAVTQLAIAAAACGWMRDAAGLTIEIERRYPGSKIEIRSLHDGGVQTVEVKIIAPSLADELNLAEEAREIAALIQRQYELGEDDTVAVEFQVEERLGVFATRRGASFRFPASEVAGAD
jgi:hypothetical protein